MTNDHQSESETTEPGFNIYDQAPDYYDATLSPEYIEQCFIPIRRLINSLRKPGGVSILDLCCGTGVIPDLLRDLDGVSYLGLDINPTFLDRARQRMTGNEHFTFVEADLLKHEFDQKFDIVMMTNGYHHFENQLKSQVVKRVHGLLVPEGSFILYEMCISSYDHRDEFVRAVMNFYGKRIEWTRKNEAMTPKKLAAWENVRDLSVSGRDEYKVDYDYIIKDFHANGFALNQVIRVWPPENENLFDDSRVGDFIFLFGAGNDSKHSGLSNLSRNSEDVATYYDNWSDDYDETLAGWCYDAPEQVASTLAAKLPLESVVLDAGCGTGLSGRALRSAGFETVDGIDVSRRSLKSAGMSGAYRTLRLMDMQRFPFSIPDDQYDGLVCVGVLTYLTDSISTLREFNRIVRSGGIVVFTQRSDLFEERMFRSLLKGLSDEGCIEHLQISDPCPYLPDNEEFGDTILVHYVSYTVM